MMATSKKSRLKGLKIVQDECIWMKAGVVNFRLCDSNYDCINCNFDKSMAKIPGDVPPGWDVPREPEARRAGSADEGSPRPQPGSQWPLRSRSSLDTEASPAGLHS